MSVLSHLNVSLHKTSAVVLKLGAGLDSRHGTVTGFKVKMWYIRCLMVDSG